MDGTKKKDSEKKCTIKRDSKAKDCKHRASKNKDSEKKYSKIELKYRDIAETTPKELYSIITDKKANINKIELKYRDITETTPKELYSVITDNPAYINKKELKCRDITKTTPKELNSIKTDNSSYINKKELKCRDITKTTSKEFNSIKTDNSAYINKKELKCKDITETTPKELYSIITDNSAYINKKELKYTDIFSTTSKELNSIISDRSFKKQKKLRNFNELCSHLSLLPDGRINEKAKEILFKITNDKSIEYARKEYRKLSKQHFGENIYEFAPKPSFITMILSNLKDATLLLLLGAGLLSLGIGFYKVVYEKDNLAWIEGVAILAAISAIVIISACNQHSQEVMFSGLIKRSLSSTTKIFCDGKFDTAISEQLLVGETVVVEPGDAVAADCMLLPSNSCVCDESMVSGESQAVFKSHDGDGVLVSGSFVVEGCARALVLSVGSASVQGQVMAGLTKARARTPLETKIARLAAGLARKAVALSCVLFVGHVLKLAMGAGTPSVTEMLAGVVASISIVVMAVPEGLPMAITIALSVGTRRMLRDGLLVRHLAACETMNNADVICADKTGTLTHNVMTARGMFASNHFYNISQSVEFAKHQRECKKSEMKRKETEGECKKTEIQTIESERESKMTSWVIEEMTKKDNLGIKETEKNNKRVENNKEYKIIKNEDDMSDNTFCGVHLSKRIKHLNMKNIHSHPPEELLKISNNIHSEKISNENCNFLNKNPLKTKTKDNSHDSFKDSQNNNKKCNKNVLFSKIKSFKVDPTKINYTSNEDFKQFSHINYKYSGNSSNINQCTYNLIYNKLQDDKSTLYPLNANLLSPKPNYNFSDNKLLILNGALNSSAFINSEGIYVGSQTEAAILKMLQSHNIDFTAMRKSTEIIHRIPFTSERKYMATLISHEYKFMALFKGAPELIISSCDHELVDGEIVPFKKDKVCAFLEKCAQKNLRTLAFCCSIHDTSSTSALEITASKRIFLGVVSMEDPLRDDVCEKISLCKQSGIVLVMLTGDKPDYARSLAQRVGILEPGQVCLTGPEFRALSSCDLNTLLPRIRVISRASPMDKKRYVELMQEKGHIVTVTGDGSNDGPALKAANVGFGMGRSGTEIAKAASSVILINDNFASLTKCIEWGRCINASVRKFIQFQLSATYSTIILATISLLFQKDEQYIFTPVTLLWINIIMDTFAVLALSTDKPQNNLILKNPEHQNSPIITTNMKIFVTLSTIYQSISILILYYLFNKNSTYIFNTYVYLLVFNQTNARSLSPGISILSGILDNKLFWFSNLIIVCFQYFVTQHFNTIFKTEPLSFHELISSAFIGFSILPSFEIIRFMRLNIRNNKHLTSLNKMVDMLHLEKVFALSLENLIRNDVQYCELQDSF